MKSYLSNTKIVSWTALVISITSLFIAVITSGWLVSDAIYIKEATYGGNCGGKIGNATEDILKECADAGKICNYQILVEKLGDPKNGCAKDYVVEYACKGMRFKPAIRIAPEAGLGTKITLDCSS